MKNKEQIVHLKWHVWYKTQDYPPHGKNAYLILKISNDKRKYHRITKD